MGLLKNDEEWFKCLDEAATTNMPKQMRQLFAYILIFNQPTYPQALWEQFKLHLAEDYIRQFGQDHGVT